MTGTCPRTLALIHVLADHATVNFGKSRYDAANWRGADLYNRLATLEALPRSLLRPEDSRSAQAVTRLLTGMRLRVLFSIDTYVARPPCPVIVHLFRTGLIVCRIGLRCPCAMLSRKATTRTNYLSSGAFWDVRREMFGPPVCPGTRCLCSCRFL